MSRKELGLQADICKSIRAEGGWGRKLSHRTLVGLPDLLLARYPFIPILAEVKDLGLKNQTFDVKLDVTEKQRHELLSFDKAIPEAHAESIRHMSGKRWASALLVGWAWGRERWLAMLPPDATRLILFPTPDVPMVRRQPKNYYPIGTLMDQFGDLHRVKLL